MSALWTAAELAAAAGGTATRDFTASGVSIDSRTIAPGDLFVALAGPSFDGHDFLDTAFARGAAGALVSRVPAGAESRPLVIVGDTLAGLTAMGNAARRRTTAKIVGITGSVGKTGTKEALRMALSGEGPTHASAASFNNHWGVPLTLARMPLDAAFGVLELGMNHAGELTVLSRLARPHVAVITTIEAAHLGYFDSVEAIADAKAEIFRGIEPGGIAVLNRDNPHFARLAAAAGACGVDRIIAFGEHPGAEVRLVESRLAATTSAAVASVMGQVVCYSVAVPGRHWVMNSLAVLAAVAAIGGDVGRAAASLANLPGLPGRGLRHSLALGGGSCELIDESYNANPASMRAAIAVLGAAEPKSGGRRIAVLGVMRELGDRSAALHAGLAAPLVEARIDRVLTVGDDMEALQEALPAAMRGAHRASAAELAPLVLAELGPGDVVMVKGSLSTRMADIVKPLLAAGQGGAATPPAIGAAA